MRLGTAEPRLNPGTAEPRHERPARPARAPRHGKGTARAGKGRHGWLVRDPARLAASLEEFAGHPAYNNGQLRNDLERFTFLLGGSDGVPLFGQAPE